MNYLFYKSNINFDFNLQKWLETLTGLELFAFVIFCFNGVILNALLSIVFILYGEFLIYYFKIEERYPKLAKFIKYRRQIQNFSIKYNLMIIFLSTFPPLYASFLVFRHYFF